MKYSFKNYEDLVLARLATLKTDFGGPCRIVKGYAGEIVLTEDGLVLVLLDQFPAVLAEISAADYRPGPNPFFTEEVTVTLHVCARSLRSQDEARGGDAGCYPLLQEVRRLLMGHQLAADLLPLLPQRVQRLVAGVREGQEHIMVYRAEYKFTNNRVPMEV